MGNRDDISDDEVKGFFRRLFRRRGVPKVDREHETRTNWLDAVIPDVIEAVAAAERRGQGHADGRTKLDIAARFLNARIDIPLMPEWLEQHTFRILLSFTVQLFNRAFGKTGWHALLVDLIGDNEVRAVDALEKLRALRKGGAE